MLVHDIMTSNVVTVSSHDDVFNVRRTMQYHGFRRVPVVDDGKLVGIVTSARIERIASTTSATNVWDLAYSLGFVFRTTVKDVMQTDVVTVPPDMTIEAAVALAQSRKVGALVVVDEKRRVMGIITTNDFFFRIVNPVLGVGEAGERVWIAGGGESGALEEIIPIVNRMCAELVTLHIIKAPNATKKDLVVHVICGQIEKLLSEIQAKGYRASIRQR